MYDLLIKNGAIIDGTGKEAFVADIAIKDGKIVRIETDIEESAEKIIDAKNLTVTPGFIDSHSHSDNAILDYPDMVEKLALSHPDISFKFNLIPVSSYASLIAVSFKSSPNS